MARLLPAAVVAALLAVGGSAWGCDCPPCPCPPPPKPRPCWIEPWYCTPPVPPDGPQLYDPPSQDHPIIEPGLPHDPPPSAE